MSANSVAETLLEWLGSLSPPVVPHVHYADALDGAGSAARSRLLVAHLSPLHYRCFHYVAAFLRARIETRVLAAADESGAPTGDDDAAPVAVVASGATASEVAQTRRRAELAHLAALFGPTLLRPAPPLRPSLPARRRAALFLTHFLVDPNATFDGVDESDSHTDSANNRAENGDAPQQQAPIQQQ